MQQTARIASITWVEPPELGTWLDRGHGRRAIEYNAAANALPARSLPRPVLGARKTYDHSCYKRKLAMSNDSIIGSGQ